MHNIFYFDSKESLPSIFQSLKKNGNPSRIVNSLTDMSMYARHSRTVESNLERVDQCLTVILTRMRTAGLKEGERCVE